MKMPECTALHVDIQSPIIVILDDPSDQLLSVS